MITYTYRCENCRRTYDIQQRISDLRLTKCPVCKSLGFKRVISVPTVITKSKTSSTSRQESVAAFGPGGLNCAMDPNFSAPALGVRLVLRRSK